MNVSPFEEAKRILPDPMSDHGAAVDADRHLLNSAGLLFWNDRHVIDLQTLRSMVARFLSEESALLHEATTQFMKLLSNDRSPPMEEVFQSGVSLLCGVSNEDRFSTT